MVQARNDHADCNYTCIVQVCVPGDCRVTLELRRARQWLTTDWFGATL